LRVKKRRCQMDWELHKSIEQSVPVTGLWLLRVGVCAAGLITSLVALEFESRPLDRSCDSLLAGFVCWGGSNILFNSFSLCSAQSSPTAQLTFSLHSGTSRQREKLFLDNETQLWRRCKFFEFISLFLLAITDSEPTLLPIFCCSDNNALARWLLLTK